MSNTKDVYAKLSAAWRVSCPIVSLKTSDPAQALRAIIATLNADTGKPVIGVVNWDVAQGASIPTGQSRAANDIAAAAAGSIGADQINLCEALIAAQKMPKNCVLVVQNAQAFIEKPDVTQAVWNLRDPFKASRRMVILMATSLTLPSALQHDVVELDEPLPTHAELAEIVTTLASDSGVKVTESEVSDAAAAAQGLSAFAAEQLAALNLTRAGVNTRGLWADKCHKIDETPGLRVVSGGSFADVAGVENAKGFLRQVLNGRDKPNAIVFVDEIEKALGGSGTDSSGVSQDQLGVLLQWMQDKRAAGCIYVGPPGAAKSALAKTAGGEVGIPTIQLDLGGMKGSLVGESETRIRDALKVVDAVSGGKTLWLATCNSLTALPPELRRRFKYGTWFFDLPTLEEREAIWSLYCTRYEHEQPSERMLAEEWTGAEIESCCEIAWKTGLYLEAAADYIVPVSKAAAPQIEALRAGADGKFLSASNPGVYSRSVSRTTRQLSL